MKTTIIIFYSNFAQVQKVSRWLTFPEPMLAPLHAMHPFRILLPLQMPNKIPFNVFWKLCAPTFGKTGQQYNLPFLQRFYTDQTRRVHPGSNTRMTSCRRNWTVVKRVTLSSPFRIWWISQNDIIETLWYAQLYPSNLQHWQHRDGYQQALLWEQ